MLWFVSHKRILRRAERRTFPLLFKQKYVFQRKRPATRVSFELYVRKVMFGVSKCPTNWHWHWAGMIYGRKTKECFSSGRGVFMEVITNLQLSPLVVLVQFASLSFSGTKNHKYIQLRQTADFLPCLSLTSYIFCILSTEFNQSYLMHFKEWYRCMLGRNLMDWPVLLCGGTFSLNFSLTLFALTNQKVSY